MLILILIIYLLLLLLIFCIRYLSLEHFAINDFYDKYLNIVSVPTDFYNAKNAILPETQYAAEVNDRFFLDTFNKEISKNKESIPYSNAIEYKKDNLSKLLIKINKYLVNILNSNLDSSERFMFNIVYSKINDCFYWQDEDTYMIHSEHVVYRDTKIYGVSISLTTLYTKNINLLNYKLNGFIFEDKISDYTPSNLDDSEYQDFRKDKIFMKDSTYEKNYLCKYYDDVKKFRGLQVYDNNLHCPNQSDKDLSN